MKLHYANLGLKKAVVRLRSPTSSGSTTLTNQQWFDTSLRDANGTTALSASLRGNRVSTTR